VGYGGRWRCSGCPAWAASSSNRSCKGGGAVDHARHQRPSTTQRVSQPRTRRRVTGQATIPGLAAGLTGPLPPDGRLGGGWLVCSWPWRGMLGEPGPPAERERAADQGPVAADRPVAADLEVGPAEPLACR